MSDILNKIKLIAGDSTYIYMNNKSYLVHLQEENNIGDPKKVIRTNNKAYKFSIKPVTTASDILSTDKLFEIMSKIPTSNNYSEKDAYAYKVTGMHMPFDAIMHRGDRIQVTPQERQMIANATPKNANEMVQAIRNEYRASFYSNIEKRIAKDALNTA